jgi:hypothetical protein
LRFHNNTQANKYVTSIFSSSHIIFTIFIYKVVKAHIQAYIDEVKEFVKVKTYVSMLKFLQEAKPSLWGEQQPKSFLEHMMVLTLVKDRGNIGYHTLLQSVELPYPLSYKSINHNVQSIRRSLGKWGKKQVKLGNKKEWEAVARLVRIPKIIKDRKNTALLWIDSTDFPRNKFKGYTKKSPWHSYKLDSPGRRYMFVRNGKGKVVKMWGGYTPKLYDGHFVEVKKEEFDEAFEGSAMVGDCHFKYGAKFVEDVTFYTPNNNTEEEKEEQMSDEAKHTDPFEFSSDEEEETSKIKTKKDKEWDSAIKTLRARVESVFGFLDKKFKALHEKFGESPRQHDYLVYYATGIYNCIKN